jgi:hypothetical protein
MRASSFVLSGVLLLFSAPAFAADGGSDASTDASAADAGDAAVSDAAADAASDAASEAGKLDAASDAPCDPNIEPCTFRPDSGTGDQEPGTTSGGGGGCSCESAPLDAGTVSPLLLVAAAVLARGLRKKK